MKLQITCLLLFAGLNLFAQFQDSLELDNLCHKCLEEARLPRPDTLDCYPVVTKMCLEKIKTTYNKLYDRLEGAERKK